MDLAERRMVVMSMLNSRGGMATKAIVVGTLMLKGLSRGSAYDLINVMIAGGSLGEVKKNRQKFLIAVRESP